MGIVHVGVGLNGKVLVIILCDRSGDATRGKLSGPPEIKMSLGGGLKF